MSDTAFRQNLLAALPSLRATAMRLARNASLRDDLVQDTVERAWRARERFVAGTSMASWLSTICRNHFLTLSKREARYVELPVEDDARSTPPDQLDRLALQDALRAIGRLPATHARALCAYAVDGRDHAQIAAEAGVAIDTIKVRVFRARQALREAA